MFVFHKKVNALLTHCACSSNQISGPGVTSNVSIIFTVYFNLFPFRANNLSLKTYLATVRNEPKQSISTAWQITEVSNSEKRRVVNIGNHADLYLLKLVVIKDYETAFDAITLIQIP